MIIWSNLIRNILCILLNLLFTLIFTVVKTEEENDVKNLLFFGDFILFIMINGTTIYYVYNNPIFLKLERLTCECVVCWDPSKEYGIRCKNCNNVAICLKCYLIWEKKNNDCPLCRFKFDKFSCIC